MVSEIKRTAELIPAFQHGDFIMSTKIQVGQVAPYLPAAAELY